MGSRNGRILPVIVSLENPDITILDGKKRTQVFEVPASGAAMVSWMIKTDTPQQITVRSMTMNAWSDEKDLSVGGAK